MVREFAESRFLYNPGFVTLTLTHVDILHTYRDHVAKFCGNWWRNSDRIICKKIRERSNEHADILSHN